MEFRILGPLEVIDDGRSLELGSPQQRALLGLLVLHANRVVTTDRIVEELWGDDAVGKEKTLWVYVSRLRSIFEPNRADRGQNSILLTRDHGYSLSVDLDLIDSRRFEEMATEARSLVEADPGAASDLLVQALELWRGSVLEGSGDHEFARIETTRLEELRLTALEDRIEADLRQGRAGELVGELEGLRREHPLHESFVTYLMLAQYRSGRHANALRVFDRFRRHLGEELGIEPSPELCRLEEQVLLHDPGIHARLGGAEARGGPIPAAENPFKGLRAFGEEDSKDFFGRDRPVADIVRRIEQGKRCIALVGPSGSGKSSIVRAGVIPALRKGGVAGSEGWLIAQMVPGERPFAELEISLLRSSIDAPDSLAAQLAAPEDGMLRAALRMLPGEDSHMVLFIDQFEELFTLVRHEGERRRFITGLTRLINDPYHRVTVVLALRADFYERPLYYPEFSRHMGEGIVNVVPLAPDELEEAAGRPADAVRVAVAPALLASLLIDVLGQPGALPLFQFALTELFDRRNDNTLTLDGYRAMGGLQGALSQRADELYAGLDSAEQAAARQLLLRLVAIGENDKWGRRRVGAPEIVSLRGDLVPTQAVIEQFTAHRLLTVDRDPVSGSPTVEVAHEALLTEWPRLRAWINESRTDLVRLAALTTAMDEWIEADQHPDYLLAGSRHEAYKQWAATATTKLTVPQTEYLKAAVEHRSHTRRSEEERVLLAQKAERTSRRRLWGLAAAVVVGLALSIGVLLLVDQPNPTQVAVVAPSAEMFGTSELLETGIANAERELGVEVELLTARFTSLEQQYRDLANAGTELIFIDPDNSGRAYVQAVIADHPETAFAVIDGIIPALGARSVYFADQEAAFVAGIAAALTSETGVVGFVGGHQSSTTERWRAGFESGVRIVDPRIEVESIYVSTQYGGFQSIDGGRIAAEELFQRNADVILAFAQDATLGVIEAAWQQSLDTGTQRWAIGSDADWSVDVGAVLRPHVLTSAVRKHDVALVETIRAFTEGTFTTDVTELGLSSGAVGLAPPNHLTTGDLIRIDELSTDVAEGRQSVPLAPTGNLLPPPDRQVVDTVTVIWNGDTCSYTGKTEFETRSTVRVDFVNESAEYWEFAAIHLGQRGIELSLIAQPMSDNSGYFTFAGGQTELRCVADSRKAPLTIHVAATLTASLP